MTLAVLRRAWGRRGELSAESLSRGPERFQAGQEVWAFRPDAAASSPQRLEVESAWQHKGRLILKFRGVDSISAAELLEGAEVRTRMDQRAALREGEYYQSDLVGCEVIDRRTGERLGTVSGWEEYGAAPLIAIEREGAGEPLLIPFARSICVEVDLAARRVVVELPEGLKDLNAE